jgi:hypothetical protein
MGQRVLGDLCTGGSKSPPAKPQVDWTPRHTVLCMLRRAADRERSPRTFSASCHRYGFSGIASVKYLPRSS